MAVAGASAELGEGEPCVCLCFAVGVGEVLLLGGAGPSEGQPIWRPPHRGPAPPAPARASVVIWNVRSQGDILLIRQTQTGNLYKHKRIHFQKNKLLRGEEERVHFVSLNKYAILLT